MQNYLLYQASGSIDQMNECQYALLKYISLYNLKTPHTTSVVIFTDKPALFESFSSFIENFEMKPPSSLSRFEMIKHVAEEYEGNLLFCDTDTYPIKSLEVLFKDLSDRKIYLYQENIKESLRTMIIGVNTSNKNILYDIIKDEKLHDETQLNPKLSDIKNAGLFFRHYRNLPEFKKLLQTFFTKTQEESVPNLIKAAHHFDAQQIQIDKEQYSTLPFYKKWFKNITGTGWSIKQYEKKF
ncbi:MAG TPA: hypothetical protein VNA26_06090 [Chitinophagaceae bacterium]|nr:hypothetical protein [Chitinophagaceae bacterium]